MPGCGVPAAASASLGFTGQQQLEEDRRIILDSLQRYPFMHLRAAIFDSVLQFLMFRTGDGIEPQNWVLEAGFRRIIPNQVRDYLGARQQRACCGSRS